MKREALLVSEKAQLWRRKQAGATLKQIAAELGCSVVCARKHWRRLREEKEAALRPAVLGTPLRGPLSRCAAVVVEAIQRCKREHPLWGADRMVAALRRQQEEDVAWQAYHLPKRSQVNAFLRLHFPQERAPGRKRAAATGAPSPATAAHEVWQMDMKEDVRLGDNALVSICTIRDVFSAAIITSIAFLTCEPASTPYAPTKRGRKLSIAQLWSVFEAGSSHWQTLPKVLQTDNEGQFVGSTASDFPSVFTLRLVSYGVAHHHTRPHRPTDNAHVERTHRTLAGFTFGAADLATLETLQGALTREVADYNRYFNSRAKHCCTATGQGQPPLVAHPALYQPLHPYPPHDGASPFQSERVYAHFAGLQFQRKTTAKAQLSLGGVDYTVGAAHARRPVIARFDAATREWVFTLASGEDAGAEIARRPDKNITPEVIQSLFQPRSVHNPVTP